MDAAKLVEEQQTILRNHFERKTSDGVYYLSDLDYSTREDILKCLKIDECKDIVDLKYRMKLTDTETFWRVNTCKI